MRTWQDPFLYILSSWTLIEFAEIIWLERKKKGRRKKNKNNYVWCKKILSRSLIYDQGISAFSGEGWHPPWCFECKPRDTCCPSPLEVFGFFFFNFFFPWRKQVWVWVGGFRPSQRGARSPCSPQQEKGRSLCQLVGSCGKLARCGACPGGGAALLPAVAADWEPGGNGCLAARYFLAISSRFAGKGGKRK